MKSKILVVLAVTGLLAVANAPAGLVTVNSSLLNGGTPIPVPDGNPVGIQSTLNTGVLDDSGILGGDVTFVSMTLNISDGNNGDLKAYLSYGGQIVTLLNRPGVTDVNPVGYTDTGLNVILSDGNSYKNINTTPNPTTGGTYNPASGSTAFASYNGLNPNGNWTLFIADMSGGDISFSQLDSWSLTFDAVPEPVSVALGVFAGLLLAVAWLRRLRRSSRATIRQRT